MDLSKSAMACSSCLCCNRPSRGCCKPRQTWGQAEWICRNRRRLARGCLCRSWHGRGWCRHKRLGVELNRLGVISDSLIEVAPVVLRLGLLKACSAVMGVIGCGVGLGLAEVVPQPQLATASRIRTSEARILGSFRSPSFLNHAPSQY